MTSLLTKTVKKRIVSSTAPSAEPFNDAAVVNVPDTTAAAIKEELHAEMAEFIKEEMDRKKEEIVDSIHNEFEKKEDESKDTSDSQSEIRRRYRSDILAKFIYPNHEETLKILFEDKKFYAWFLQLVRATRILFSALLIPALLLSDSQFSGHYLNYVAAIFSFTLAVLEATDRVIVWSSKKRTEKINEILASIGIISRIPDTTLDDPLKEAQTPPKQSTK